VVKKISLPVAICYTIVLVTVTLINLPKASALGFTFLDKFYHLVAYLILSVLWCYYVLLTKNKNLKNIVFFALLVVAVVLEYIQDKVNPNRFFDLYDMLANVLGVILGILVVEIFKNALVVR